NGFIILVALVLISLLGLLWFGVARERAWIVRLVFVIAILPGLSPIARLVYVVYHRLSDWYFGVPWTCHALPVTPGGPYAWKHRRADTSSMATPSMAAPSASL